MDTAAVPHPCDFDYIWAYDELEFHPIDPEIWRDVEENFRENSSNLVYKAIRDSLFGAAYGDAFGAPVEDLKWTEIAKKFGPNGVQTLLPWQNQPAGSVAGGFQMLFATGLGLFRAFLRWEDRGIVDIPTMIHLDYRRWYALQNSEDHRRSPGDVGTASLNKIETWGQPAVNACKGCGGAMRVAPIGLVFDANRAFALGCESASLTHGQAAAIVPAGILAATLSGILSGKPLLLALNEASLLARSSGIDCSETLESFDKAISLKHADLTPDELNTFLGEGRTGHTALAISVYCALRYEKEPQKALEVAVNHSGNSDSTGSMTASILGATGVAFGRSSQIEKWENIAKMAKVLFYLRKYQF